MAHKNNPDHWNAKRIRERRKRGTATAAEIKRLATYERTQCGVGRPRGRLEMMGHATRVDDRAVNAYLGQLARRVHDLRIELDISLQELGAATGMDAASISRIERNVGRRGRARGTNKGRGGYVETIVRIALGLGVTPGEIL